MVDFVLLLNASFSYAASRALGDELVQSLQSIDQVQRALEIINNPGRLSSCEQLQLAVNRLHPIFDATDLEGNTPLILAVQKGQIEVVKALLNGKKINLNKINKEGQTALGIAVKENHPKIVELLLNAGADESELTLNLKKGGKRPIDLEVIDDLTYSLLDYAYDNNSPDIMEMLIRKGCRVHHYRRAFFALEAVKYGHKKVLQALFDQGYGPDIHDEEGITPLMEAVKTKNTEIIQFLLDPQSYLKLVANQKRKKESALAPFELKEVIKKLVNLPDKEGMTPLHLAINNKDVETVELLLKSGASADLNDRYGRSLLMYAASEGNEKIFDLFLKYHLHLDLDHKDKNGGTLLHYAARGGNLKTFQTLKKWMGEKMMVNVQDKNGRTPLLLAASWGHDQMVTALIQQGANLNHQDHQGITALMEAAKNENTNTLRILLSHDAFPDLQSEGGKTALIHALLSKENEAASFLITAGSDLRLPTKENLTAYSIIQEKKSHPGFEGVYEALVLATKPVPVSEAKLSKSPILKDYDFKKIASGVLVNRTIKPFSLKSSDDILREQKEYLNLPKIKELKCTQLLQYFDSRFSGGRLPLVQSDPAYLNPNQLVDFSTYTETDHDIQYKPISIGLARNGISKIVKLCESEVPSQIPAVYDIKKIIEFMKDRKSPDDINKSIVILASAGQHCSTGNIDGVQRLKAILMSGQGDRGAKTPQHLEEYIASILDQEREEVFRNTINFVDDEQTPHTNHVLRTQLGDELGIAKPTTKDAYRGYFYHSKQYVEYSERMNGIHADYPSLSLQDLIQIVRNRFYYGKIGDPTVKAGKTSSRELEKELRRSHEGYTVPNLAATVIQNLLENPKFNSEIIPTLAKNLDKKLGIKDQQILNWAKKSEYLYETIIGEKPSESDPQELKENWGIVEGSATQLPLQTLKEEYVRTHFTKHYDNKTLGGVTLPNSEGLKKLLTIFDYFQPVRAVSE